MDSSNVQEVAVTFGDKGKGEPEMAWGKDMSNLVLEQSGDGDELGYMGLSSLSQRLFHYCLSKEKHLISPNERNDKE